MQSETFHAPTRPSPDELFVCFSKFTSGPRPRATKPPYISGWKPANEIRETLQLPSQTIFRGARTRENGYLQPIIVRGQPRREKKIHNVRESPLDDTRRRHERKGTLRMHFYNAQKRIWYGDIRKNRSSLLLDIFFLIIKIHIFVYVY